MLTPEYLDSVPDNVVNLYSDIELKIIEDMARRISKTDMLTEGAEWQYKKALELSSTHEYISQELSRLTGKTQGELRKLFADAGTETLLYDDKIYRSAGLSPKSLSESKALVQVIETGLKKTNNLFKNLTKTTANTATKQFENALDTAYTQIISGAFDYQTAIKDAIKHLSTKGIASIVYPTGHTDYLDTAVRRATLTGVSQTALKLQEERANEMECDLVEITAHAGARPEHQEWQGKVFSRSGKNKRYPPFSQTGYGTGAGLGGWNCRHGYYPFFEGISEKSNTNLELLQMNNRTVTYNDKKLTAYEATQLQREIERNIRKYKREGVAMEAAGFDSHFSKGKVKEWQAKQRDFIAKTGLKRDYFRERAGKQNLEKPLNSGIIPILPNHDKAIIALEKFTGYALNPQKDFDKATAFKNALGYDLSNAHKLMDNIMQSLPRFKAKEKPSNEYGRLFEVKMYLIGENGKGARVKTGWIVEKETGKTRLTSAYIDKKKR